MKVQLFKSTIMGTVIALTFATSVYSPPILANDIITCESRKQRYNTCPIQSHGYVILKRQTSRAACIQGQTWDYDKRQIWVDENCKGEFEVQTRNHSKGHGSNSSADALAAVAALAIIAAVASSSKDDKNSKYNDDNYYGSRHSSYVPNWMIGRFEGFNIDQGVIVKMDISEDGEVSARVAGTRLSGYVNDERLYIGDVELYIDREGKGFTTTQVGNTSNQVHYTRR